jgi:hypothetical protein
MAPRLTSRIRHLIGIEDKKILNALVDEGAEKFLHAMKNPLMGEPLEKVNRRMAQLVLPCLDQLVGTHTIDLHG